MPPKVTDNRSANNESLHAVEAETAAAAQRIVATYSEDFLDAATLMCMLGVEPEGLIHRRVVAELEEAEQEATKRASKKAAKKTTKKAATKSTAKKTTKKSTKKAASKSAAKKTTKKAATKSTAKKTTKKTTKKAE